MVCGGTPAVLRNEKAQPPDMGRPEGADGCFLSRAITDEYEWLDQVKISVNQESHQGETPVAWAVHHANVLPKQAVMPAEHRYFLYSQMRLRVCR